MQQSQPEARGLPALQLTIPGEDLQPLPGNHMLGGFTSQKEPMQEVQASPAGLVNSLQQLQLSENALESQLLCHESLADSSSRLSYTPTHRNHLVLLSVSVTGSRQGLEPHERYET